MPATPLAPTHVAESLKQDWRGGSAPDLRAALRDHPTLLRHRSLVLDLAYEAYALREAAGSALDPESFCRELPAFQSDVRGMLLDYQALMAHPELLEGPEPVRYPEPGESFEGFTVVRQLGHGAFARAYLATDPDTGGRRVVLKLSPTASGESRAQGQVRHPHVAEVLWARRVGGMSAICMPYGGAATLRDVVAAAFELATGAPTARTVVEAIDAAGVGLPPPNDPVPPPLLVRRGSYADAVARVAARLAGALAHLHRQKLTHGDLKPSNIVLAPGGHPYLIDFNLAGRDGETKRYGGTLPYMAPERVRRLADRQAPVGDGAPSDVYSFGAVVYEALTGRVPFEPVPAEGLAEMATAHLWRQLAGAPRLAAAGVPRGLARLVDRCLSADPGRRPTAAELEAALARCVRRRVRRALRLSLVVVGALSVGAGTWHATGLPSTPESIPSGRGLPARPVTADELRARGSESLAAGDVVAAATDFRRAFQLRPDGRTAALLGYCRSRSADHPGAMGLYREALTRGYREAWVHNNLAFALIQAGLGNPPAVRPALAEAQAALDIDPYCRAALYNRAWARFESSIERPAWTVRDPKVLAGLDRDLAALLDNPPEGHLPYFLAARILAAPADAGETRLAAAVRHVEKAVSLGLPTKSAAGDPVTRRLRKRDDFKSIRDPEVPAPKAADPALIDPPAR